MPPPSTGIGQGISVVCPWLHASRKVWYIGTRWTKFHQTLNDDEFQVTDKLIRFRRSRGQDQGRFKVKYAKLWNPSHTLSNLTDFDKIWHTYILHRGYVGLQARAFKVKVTARSKIWVSYYDRRSNSIDAWASKYHLAAVLVPDSIHSDLL